MARDAREDARLVEVCAAGAATDRADDERAQVVLAVVAGVTARSTAATAHPVPAVERAAAVALARVRAAQVEVVLAILKANNKYFAASVVFVKNIILLLLLLW